MKLLENDVIMYLR